MIYQYDQALPLPTKDLYDTQIMQMAISTAKDMYDRGEKRIQDIYDKYQDFYSPIASDVDFVHNETVGKLQKAIDQMYANGEDPLRTAEGRAKIAQLGRSINTAEIAKRKEAAENAKMYKAAASKLKAEGLYSEDLERYMLGGKTLEEWDTEKDGLFTATSPTKYKTIDDIIEPMVKHLEPIYDEALTKAMKDGKNHYTVSEDRIRDVIDDNLPDLIMNKTVGGYYYQQALKQTGDPTKALELLKDWYVDRAKDHVRHKEEVDPYALDDYKTANQIKLDSARTTNDMRAASHAAAVKYNYETQGLLDANRDGVVSDQERKDYEKLVAAERQALLSKYGGEGDDNKTLDIGAATALATQQQTDYIEKKDKYIKDNTVEKSQAESDRDNAYKKLSDSEKKNADLYVHYYKKYNNSKDKKEKDHAKKQLDALNRKKDDLFLKWRNAYLKSQSDYDHVWENYSTTQGRAGYMQQTSAQLYNRSKEIWDKLYRVSSLDSDQYKDINKHLNYHVDPDDGNVTGVMDSSRHFAAIHLAAMAGDRKYKYSSAPKEIDRIIKGKPFKVDKYSEKTREYGSGTIEGNTNNIVYDEVIFDDPTVVSKLKELDKKLKKLKEKSPSWEGLESFGIVYDKDTNGYRIPITTARPHGLGWAAVDTASDERVGGKAEASKKSATRQAQQMTSIILESKMKK